MTEQNAKGVKGFILYSPVDDRHFFRVYGEYDPVTKRKSFKDFKLTIEDLEVEILCGGAALIEKDDGSRFLDWDSKVLGRHKRDDS